jgi:hypothetical protein
MLSQIGYGLNEPRILFVLSFSVHFLVPDFGRDSAYVAERRGISTTLSPWQLMRGLGRVGRRLNCDSGTLGGAGMGGSKQARFVSPLVRL